MEHNNFHDFHNSEVELYELHDFRDSHVELLKFHDFISKFLLMLNSFAKWILVDLIVKHQVCTVQI